MKTIVIMQPTYLPWLGFFDLMFQSDCFVFLDSVQFEKRSWQQRNRIKTSQGIQILTVPVHSKGKFNQKLNEVEIDKKNNFHEKHLKSFLLNYSKAKYFQNYFPEIEKVYKKNHDFLIDLNIDLINYFTDKINLKKEIVRSSEIPVSGNRTQLLINICLYLNGEEYLSPIGSKDYIKNNIEFRKSNIKLKFHNYSHPTYPQLNGDFISHLSFIDLLFNEGSNSESIIKKS